MIREEGIVTDFKNGLVRVRIGAKTSCHGCKLCDRGKDGMVMEINVNTVFTPGDPVYLDIEGRNILLCFFMLYMFPVISFMSGIVLGLAAAKILKCEQYVEIFEIISGFIFFGISIFIVKEFDNKYRKKTVINVKNKKEV